MRNVTAEVKGTSLIVTIDLTQDLGPSKSGKTTLIGTTEGNVKVHTPKGDVSLGVNCYRPIR